MDLDLNLIQTIFTVLGGGLIGGTTYIWNKYINQVSVKLIKDPNDSDIESFITLYEEIIDENIRITPDEIIKFIGNHTPTDESMLCDYLFICKKEKEVIGFLKIIYCWNREYLFIAYLGSSKIKNQSSKIASNALLLHLVKYIKKNFKSCRAIFFEVELSNIPSKRSKGLAKLRLFRYTTNNLKFPCYQVLFNYIQPEMPTDGGATKEETNALLFIPLGYSLIRNDKISKNELLDFIDFIYLDIYGRVYDDNELNEVNKMYLNDLLGKYKAELPEYIKIY